MRAKANVVFLDLECNELRRQGQVLEVTEERFAEINGKIPGALTALGDSAAAVATDADDEPAEPDDADGVDDDYRPDLDEMTCEQLREYIASRGGEAPSKAKRAELDEIARNL